MFFCFKTLKKHLGDSFARVPQPYHGSIMKSRSIQNYPRPIQKQCPWCISRFFVWTCGSRCVIPFSNEMEFCQDVKKNVERSMEITWDYITCLNMFSRLPTSLLGAFAWHIKPVCSKVMNFDTIVGLAISSLVSWITTLKPWLYFVAH